ncbi:MAG: NnrU family protein [Litorimonas sp.]
MTLFLIGLFGFLGLHLFSALRSRAPGRDLRTRWDKGRYMGLYSLLSLGFFAMIVIGYGHMPDGPPVWSGPPLARTLSVPLNTLALILVAAAYMPVGHLKRAVHHPMMIGVALWAASHLWVGGDLAKVMLVGGFGSYAAVSLAAAFRRGERVEKMPSLKGDAMAVAVGAAVAASMLYTGHGGYA